MSITLVFRISGQSSLKVKPRSRIFESLTRIPFLEEIMKQQDIRKDYLQSKRDSL
jgi:hypothetical protein